MACIHVMGRRNYGCYYSVWIVFREDWSCAYSIEARFTALLDFQLTQIGCFVGDRLLEYLPVRTRCGAPHHTSQLHTPLPLRSFSGQKELRKKVGACKPLVVPLAWPHTRGVGGKDQGHVGKADLL